MRHRHRSSRCLGPNKRQLLIWPDCLMPCRQGCRRPISKAQNIQRGRIKKRHARVMGPKASARLWPGAPLQMRQRRIIPMRPLRDPLWPWDTHQVLSSRLVHRPGCSTKSMKFALHTWRRNKRKSLKLRHLWHQGRG